jgi:hypothetical protein
VIEATARAIFDKLSEGTPKRTPSWDKQPEHLKDVFRRKVIAGNRWYHYGANLVFIIRGDLTLASYTPFTERLAMKQFNGAPPGPRYGAQIQLNKLIAKARLAVHEADKKVQENPDALGLQQMAKFEADNLAELEHRAVLIG